MLLRLSGQIAAVAAVAAETWCVYAVIGEYQVKFVGTFGLERVFVNGAGCGTVNSLGGDLAERGNGLAQHGALRDANEGVL